MGGYLVAVAWQQNLGQLWELLKQETGYLDFVIALVVLGALHKYGPTNKIADALIVMVIVGVLLRLARTVNITDITRRFANGELGIVGLVRTLLGDRT